MKNTSKMHLKNVLNYHTELPKDQFGESLLERKSFVDVFVNEQVSKDIIGVITKPVVDHDGDIIWPMGISDKYYKQNPVVQWNHDLGSPSIGVIENHTITPEGIAGTFRFSDTYDFAIDIKNLIVEKIIKGISIGFIPLKALKAGTSAFNEFAKANRLDITGCLRIVTECEWIETSIVSVGCNQEALIIAAKSFGSDLTTKALKIDEEITKDITDETIKDVVDAVSNTEVLPEPLPEPLPVVPEETTKEVIPEPIVEAPKPINITVIRRGPFVPTKATTEKALKFLAGKSF